MPTSLIEHSLLEQITRYAAEGQPHRGLSAYQKIRKKINKIPPVHFFPTLLKACTNIKDLEAGLLVHVDAVSTGLAENDLFISTCLVDLYMKCGLFTKACQAFNKVDARNVVLWTALISGYVENGFGGEGLKCVSLMQREGFSPNAFTFVCILRACNCLGYLDKGREIHVEVERKGLLRENAFVGSALVDMYAKCGLLNKAQEIFSSLALRGNIFAWTALIAGYADYGFCEEAFMCFERMSLEGICPNVSTLVCVLKACVSIGAIDKGQELHGEIERKGLMEKEVLLCSTLVHLYANGGMLVKAQEVFDIPQELDVVMWTVLIAGYAHYGHGEEALRCFEQMHVEGDFPNSFTFSCSLKACGSLKAADEGSKLHVKLESLGLTKENVFVGTSLVDMYVKCGLLLQAHGLFDKIAIRNTELWNALIAGYVEHEHGEIAIECFKQMQREGVSPDHVTFMYSLRACSSIGATIKGAEIHAEIARRGLHAEHCALGNSLLSMYAKCGWIAFAEQVYNELPIRNIFMWNSLLMGYSQIGENKGIVCGIDAMQVDGVKPDPVSFFIVHHGFGRSGISTKSHEKLKAENKENQPFPAFKHYHLVTDVLNWGVQLEMKEAMASELPSLSDISSRTSMLCTSRYLGKVELGKQAFKLCVADTNLTTELLTCSVYSQFFGAEGWC